jgi:hypothetical protein
MVADCGGHPRREMTSESSTVSLWRAHDIGTKTALHAEAKHRQSMGGRNERGGRTGRAHGNEPMRAVADTGDRDGGGAKDEDDDRSTGTLTRQEEGTFSGSRGCRPDEGMRFGVKASVSIDRSSSKSALL